MKWQEYQDAVVEFYRKAEGNGRVRRNIRRRDKVTHQLRQIDCWLEIPVKGHTLSVLVDAKFRSGKVDINDVDTVKALGEAVGADKCFLLCPNGWTEPALEKAQFIGLDLRLFDVKTAVQSLNIDLWEICPSCQNDYIMMEKSGAIELDGLCFWWMAGECKECKATMIWCQDCGRQMVVGKRKSQLCDCGHRWLINDVGMYLGPHGAPANYLIS